MFARVLNKLFKRGTNTPAAPVVKSAASTTAPPAPANSPATGAAKGGAAPSSGKAPAAPAAPTAPAAASASASSAKDQWKKQADQKIQTGAKAEDLCEIKASMTKEQIADQLAKLYRRHNRAASSLDEKMREESEVMLEAIAQMKEKHLK
jgi:predicted lipid-binding transport protein (Tim44 family)